MKSQIITSNKDCARLYLVGVRKWKSDKFCDEIRYPTKKNKILLGTFTTVEEASGGYKSKKLEFEEIILMKGKKDQISAKSDKKLIWVMDLNQSH